MLIIRIKDTFKGQLDKGVGHLVHTGLLPGKVGPQDPSGSFQLGIVLSYDSFQPQISRSSPE